MMKAVSNADYETAIDECPRNFTVLDKNGNKVLKPLKERNKATVELILAGC